MSDATSTVWLTQESYDKLAAELEQLSGPGRAEIAKRIEAAREEGDLRENGGYHAAKDEQGKIEARIRQLTELLRTATVGVPEATDEVVPGSVVTAVLFGEEARFLLGSREIDAGDDLDVYSPSSPLGAAILGLKAGDTTSYSAPSGKEIAVEIVKVEPYRG